MTFTWEVSCVTASERMAVRTIQATDAPTARRKMRRKFRVPIRSVYARLAAEQVHPVPRLDAETKALIAGKTGVEL
jgi:hypothetical protein